MLKRFRRLPSPAMVIASVALVLAVGGGSFALAISDRKGDKKIAKKVANKQITNRAPTLSVNHANTANGLPALDWQNLTLANGWVDFNSAPDPRAPAVAVDAQGI